MCTAAGGISAGASILSTLTGGITGIYAAKTQQKMYEAQGDIDRQNARLAYQKALDIGVVGEQSQVELSARASKIEGAGKTGFASSGVVLGAGSPVDWQQDLAEGYGIDRNTLQHNIEMDQWAAKVQMTNYINSANMAYFASNQAKASANLQIFGLATGLLGNAADAASKIAGGSGSSNPQSGMLSDSTVKSSGSSMGKSWNNSYYSPGSSSEYGGGTLNS